MSRADRERLTQDVLDRIDAVVSGHELQRSSEGGLLVNSLDVPDPETASGAAHLGPGGGEETYVFYSLHSETEFPPGRLFVNGVEVPYIGDVDDQR